MRILKSTLLAGLISLFVSFSSFAETVYQDGTEKKLKKKESLFLILRQESMFTVCLIQNGKKSTRNNFCFNC